MSTIHPTGTKQEVKEFSVQGFPGTFGYAEYRSWIQQLMAQGKVTGHEQSEHLMEYTRLNEYRMNRWDKHLVLSEELVHAMKRIHRKYTWLIITEGWCGDSAQILPVLHQVAALNPLVNMRIASRDDNEWLMNLYLSGGKRSIPVWVCLDEHGDEMFHWGSRPQAAVQLMEDLRKSTDPVYDTAVIKEQLHLWYARDKARALQAEILEKVKSLI